MVQLGRSVLKNSIYNSSGTLIVNISGVILTVILARLLSPEDYGIYYLAISIGFFLLTFTDLGVNGTLVRYVSHAIGNNDKKLARSYFRYLLKFNIFLTLTVSISLILFAKPLAYGVFNKPSLFLPLEAMGIFVLLMSFVTFLRMGFNALHQFKYETLKSLIYEVLRLILIPTFILLGFSVFGAMIALCLSVIVTLLVLLYFMIKNYSFLLKGEVVPIDQKKIHKFIVFLTIGSISGVIFTYVDSIMLGIYLPAEFVGFYKAGSNIVFSIAGLVTITNVLFPVFTQLDGSELKNTFNKVFKYSMVLSFPLALGLIFVSEPLVKLVFGTEYLPAVVPICILSLLIPISTTSGSFGAILNAKERPEYVTVVTVISMALNVLLNYYLILEYGIMGAAVATVISRYFNFIALVFLSKKVLDIFPGWSSFCKPLISSLMMFVFLYMIPSPDTLLTGVVGVFVGAIIYITTLFLIKGIGKEDFEYFREIIGI